MFSVTFENWNRLRKNITLAYFYLAAARRLILYFGFFFVNSFGSRKLIRNCFCCKNLSFLYLFTWNKDFKWFAKSNSNNFKRKQFNFFFTHTQAYRQTSFFLSWFFEDILFFFSCREKTDSKSVSIASLAALTKENISIIRQLVFNIA